MKKVIIANWKMNFPLKIYQAIKNNKISSSNLIICPPQAYLALSSNEIANQVKIAAQNISHLSETNGAFTGEISASMIKDLNCSFCLVGHSERRILLKETNADIKQKITYLHNQNIKAILCIGETLEEKENNFSKSVLLNQIRECLPNTTSSTNTIIAYEPIWSIGTNITASPAEISDACDFITSTLIKEFELNLDLVYGGSVSPNNLIEIISIEKLKGVLVGSAGLNLESLTELLNIVENKL